MWVDDTEFDIENHAHTAVLPAPGGERELHAFVAELLAQPLDPRHPLWEMWTVDGLEGDRVAVIPKVSHVMADGLALLGFALALLDFDPDVAPTDPPEWRPEPAPSGAHLLADALVDQARTLTGGALGVARALTRPDRLALRPGRLRSGGGVHGDASRHAWRSTDRSVPAVASCSSNSRWRISWR